MEKVSIIIPFYNCPYVDQAIESALQQTYPNVEVIVVNDGSTMYTSKIEKYVDSIVYLEKSNGGTATALNAGIRQATGDYFSWLSSDDLYHPDKIEKQLRFMQEHNASALYSPVHFIDEKGKIMQETMGVAYTDKLLFLQHLLRGCFINGCTVLVKMKLFSEIGLFDESLRYAHDYDFWMRIVQHYDFYYLPEPLVRYRIHDSMGTKRHTGEIVAETRSLQRKYYPIFRHIALQLLQERSSSKQ